MPENIRELLQHAAPFIVANAQGQPEVSTARIVEAVIIAVVVGAGAWFMIIPELRTELRYVSSEIHDIEVKQDKMAEDITQLKVEVSRDRFTASDFRVWEKQHDIEHNKLDQLVHDH